MPKGVTSKILDSVDAGSRHLVERLQKLQEIGTLLSAEQDLVRLLSLILFESRRLTGADAGSVFVREDQVETDPGATGKDPIHRVTPLLAMKVAQNDSLRLPFKEMRLPFNRSTISGHVALSGEVLNIPDAYRIPEGAPYSYSTVFDKASGYRCKSMLVVPMKNRTGDIIGVIQLINRKKDVEARLDSPEEVERSVTAFDSYDEEFVFSLASQAAVCVERTKLYDEIEKMFEGLVSSFTLALERRNRTTSGHCRRVARYTLAIAEAINGVPPEMFGGFRFSPAQLQELHYAALLHDIGKIDVPEAVLDKRNKLTDSELEAIIYRVHWAGAQGKPAAEYAEFLRRVNLPKPMSEEDLKKLAAIRAGRFTDIDGTEKPLLTDREYENLSVARGNLTDAERRQIEKHITDTWEILKRIPWPRDFRGLPNIAACHHEKVDGTGYPWRLKGDEIPLGGQIMAIVDIYEALTARDRPYKPAMPAEKAVAILQEEVDRGALNPKIWKLFLDREIYAMFRNETGFVGRPPA